MFKSYIQLAKNRLIHLAESHPYLWYIAWTLLHKLPLLFPHDRSYFALKHFCIESPTNSSLFLDIGANSGISALSFRKVNKTIPILSIEPNTIHTKNLEKLKKKLKPFEFLIMGIGNNETEIILHTPIYKRVILHTFTSFDPSQIFDAIRKSFGNRVAKKLNFKKSSTKVVPLDQLLLKPSIIKIDAEGFDYNVLLGARQTIEEYKPFLMVEACHRGIEQFDSFFKEIGFTMLSYSYESDSFSIFQKNSLIYQSGSRNIFAVANEKLHLLPIT